ncbi:MAG TPA: DegT/DnrJ/EryC1/StrS family aminotransferase [Nonomuraea sp.]|nr:DegT/DnrJ/EryC1/StrS family aminotransferase [Nonomuraea sp.]
MSKLAVNGGPPVRTAPFPAWPRFDDAERRALLRVLERGRWGGRVARAGGETAAFEAEFARFHDAPAALAVTNGTHALQLALELAGVGPGDDVLVPALTPIPTSNAVRRCGATPVPVDVDGLTYCLDPDRLDAARTGRTRALIAVHLGGHVADLDRVLRWAGRWGVAVIQDAAHAHGARWRGRGLGALGAVATFSFMQSKVMTAGEGGAVLLDDDARYGDAFARHCLGRAPGRSPARFETASSNYRMGEFAAAVLRAQLTRLAGQNERRERHWRLLAALLAGVPGLSPQGRDPRCTVHPHYLAPMVLDPEPFEGGLSRDRLVEAVQAEGIPVFPIFPPIYRLPAFWDAPGAGPRDAEEPAASCPVSERIGAWGFFLRHEALLGGERDVHDIADAVTKVLDAHRRR